VDVHGGKEVRGRVKERRRSEEGRKNHDIRLLLPLSSSSSTLVSSCCLPLLRVSFLQLEEHSPLRLSCDTPGNVRLEVGLPWRIRQVLCHPQQESQWPPLCPTLSFYPPYYFFLVLQFSSCCCCGYCIFSWNHDAFSFVPLLLILPLFYRSLPLFLLSTF